MSGKEKISREQLEERASLLRLCIGMDVVKSKQFAEKLTEEKFTEVINQIGEGLGVQVKKPSTFPEMFYGKFYTIRSGKLELGGAWEDFRNDLLEALASDQGQKAKQIIKYLLDQPSYEADFNVFKAKLAKARAALDKLLGYGLIHKEKLSDRSVKYSLYSETVPLIREVLESEDLKKAEAFTVRTDAARDELEEIKKRDEEFDNYLEQLLGERLEETLDFGKKLSVRVIANYLKEMFGPVLYFDSLLAICHQYSLTDTYVYNPEGGLATHTGFNLALFGAPGTGKTFAIYDLINGSPKKGVKAHGLPGRNRYCGGMTPAKFIRIGEAYQGKKFNFIVTEFNDWFKYKGMVEPLKLALEQGTIRYELKLESIGPYQFNSFFSTNYNTKIEGRSYKVTVTDPNFNAIEDRMLVRLHRMTRTRYKELARSQRRLALGQMRMMHADAIRDHLFLVYAIQTEHELVKDKFPKKRMVVREDAFDKIAKIRDLILEKIQGQLPFSARLERRAIQLACAMTLPSFFTTNNDTLEITEDAMNFAMKFFIEEISVRSREDIDTSGLLYQLGLSELNDSLKTIKDTKEEVRKLQDPDNRADRFEMLINEAVENLERELGSEPEYQDYEKKLSSELSDIWPKFAKESQQFLVTAVMLTDLMEKHKAVDFTPVVMEYSKALEMELKRKLFKDSNEAERMSLGQILYKLREGKLRGVSNIYSEAEFISTLQKFVKNYRNKAAHISGLKKEVAQEVREFLLGKTGLLAGVVGES